MAEKTSTWLITGASSGIGRALALEALRDGNKVLGTTRDVANAQKSCPEFEENGGVWVAVDVAAPTSGEEIEKLASQHTIDVLVNNAGYALLGALEDTSDAEVRNQMEVNYYGPLRAIRAVLPAMREHRKGHIVLISSGAGLVARPSRSSYSASKFAIEAAHEALHHEVKPFGLKVLIVEPGAFRTEFTARLITPAKYANSGGVSEAYSKGPVEQVLEATRDMQRTPEVVKGDPQKAARVIVDTVGSEHEFLRLPLGPDCVPALEMKIKWLQDDLEATRQIAVTTNYD